MRFFDVNGVLGRRRRAVSGSASVQDEEVKEPGKLAEVLRGLLRRLAEVEARQAKEAIEFEVDLSNTGKVTLTHNFNSTVRYWVTHWSKPQANGAAYPTVAPCLTMDASTDMNNLVLNTTVAGHAVIRVEPTVYAVPFNRG